MSDLVSMLIVTVITFRSQTQMSESTQEITTQGTERCISCQPSESRIFLLSV